eukprot:SM000013S26597  [mRNA]  locus=s13:1262236:1264751:- [translate_table: standard]
MAVHAALREHTTYEALETKNVFSSRFGRSRLDPDGYLTSRSLTLTSLGGKRYKVKALLHADSGAYKLFKASPQVKNFVGYIGHSDPADGDEVVVAIIWRGTITRGEWFQDITALMVSWNNGQDVAPIPSGSLDMKDPLKELGITVGLSVGALDEFDDPRVSYGFKEMYCDALATKLASAESSSGDKPPLGAPRQQVYHHLLRILKSLEKSDVRVRSMTTAGHSLGGALAALSAFDIAETLREAKKVVNLRKQGWKTIVKVSTDRDDKKWDKKSVHRRTEKRRQEFLEKLVDGQNAGYDLPTELAVTFAAPRVGDRLFAQYFGPATLMAPPFASGWHIINFFTLLDFIPDVLGSVSKAVGAGLYDSLFWILTTCLTGAIFLRTKQPIALGAGGIWLLRPSIARLWSEVRNLRDEEKPAPTTEEAKEGARMLRVRNIHDLVPKVPLGVAS